MVITISQRATSSRTEAAALAPAAASGAIFSRDRLKTVRSCPAAMRFRHIGSPMIPSPMNPTRAIAFALPRRERRTRAPVPASRLDPAPDSWTMIT